MARAAVPTASRPEPQRRLIVAAGTLVGEPGQQQRHAADVAVVLAGLVGAAVIQVVHRLPIHAGIALHQDAQRDGAEVVGADVLQRAGVAADRGADEVADEGLWHDARLLPLSGRLTRPLFVRGVSPQPGETSSHVGRGGASRGTQRRAAMWTGDAASQGLGMVLEDVGPGMARMSMTVEPRMLNGHGMCHGGFIFALADSAFAFACNSRGPAAVAQTCTITFLTAGPQLGDRLVATARELAVAGRSSLYDVQRFHGENPAGRGGGVPRPVAQHRRGGDRHDWSGPDRACLPRRVGGAADDAAGRLRCARSTPPCRITAGRSIRPACIRMISAQLADLRGSRSR